MARNRTPSNVLQMSGANKKHPERAKTRKHEPMPKAGIGPAPKQWDEQLRKVWDEIVGITPAGVLGDSDRIALELAVHLLVEYRENPKGFTTSRFAPLVSLLSRFGLTPADRTRISVPSGKGGNEFDNL